MKQAGAAGWGASWRLTQRVIEWGRFVKFSHTIFALPFALISMMAAAKGHRGWPGPRIFLLILVAMFCARTCAMAFNRIVDRRFDGLNRRTANRHLPTGRLTLRTAWTLCLGSAAGLILSTFWINRLCFFLSPVAIAIICFYSLTKRFTDWTHLFLGISLALAPLGAWIAVRGSVAAAPCVLALAVVFWLVGFDIIYAMQDEAFDREQGLHSLVVRYGSRGALAISLISHILMWGLLVVFGLLLEFGMAYFLGLGAIFVALLLEHGLARTHSVKWINIAFFRLNASISLILLAVTLVEVAFR